MISKKLFVFVQNIIFVNNRKYENITRHNSITSSIKMNQPGIDDVVDKQNIAFDIDNI